MDLALNNLQRLICHKTQQTQPNPIPPVFFPINIIIIAFFSHIWELFTPALADGFSQGFQWQQASSSLQDSSQYSSWA